MSLTAWFIDCKTFTPFILRIISFFSLPSIYPIRWPNDWIRKFNHNRSITRRQTIRWFARSVKQQIPNRSITKKHANLCPLSSFHTVLFLLSLLFNGSTNSRSSLHSIVLIKLITSKIPKESIKMSLFNIPS